MARIGDELRILVGRQHGGVEVYMLGTVERRLGDGVVASLHTTGAHIKALTLVDVPEPVRQAIRDSSKSPQVRLTMADAQASPAVWRVSKRVRPSRLSVI